MEEGMNVFVTGCGTDVGKTVVASILVKALNANYWKPIASGSSQDSDSKAIERLTGIDTHKIFPSSYSFKAPLSPHHAAKLENIYIQPDRIVLPQSEEPLVVETAGGVLVPLNEQTVTLDLFEKWNGLWVVVSRHYLGSINHTLLTLEMLKQKNKKILLVFNGDFNPESEEAILKLSNVPLLGRVLMENKLNAVTIEGYAREWKERLLKILQCQ
jgi:dethiobiotin synthetase